MPATRPPDPPADETPAAASTSGLAPVPAGEAPSERKAFHVWRETKKTRRSIAESARVLRAYAVDELLTEGEYDTAIWMAGRNEVK